MSKEARRWIAPRLLAAGIALASVGLAGCPRAERGMEFPVNTPAATAPGEVPVAPAPQVTETPRLPVQSPLEQRIKAEWQPFYGRGYVVHIPQEWLIFDGRISDSSWSTINTDEFLAIPARERIRIKSSLATPEDSWEEVVKQKRFIYASCCQVITDQATITIDGQKPETILIQSKVPKILHTREFFFYSPDKTRAWLIQVEQPTLELSSVVLSILENFQFSSAK